MLMILCSQLNLSAQITLHEATDVTQTKATLSADFPDLNSEHGFQYKYGTLPEIDEFSRVALAPFSDPILLITSPTTGWTAQNAKGWIESKTSIPVGQASSVTANVILTEDSEISFEWSVDSEDNIGILSFLVDGIEVQSITGLMDFKSVTYSVAKGEHSLTWQYVKKKETSIGLDLAKMRNIVIPNSTPENWITIKSYTSDIHLDNLSPNRSYLYRAFYINSSKKVFSTLSTFSTPPFNQDFCNIAIDPITQTTAFINPHFDIGDNNVSPTLEICTFRDGSYSYGGWLSPIFKYMEASPFRGSGRGVLKTHTGDDGNYAYSDFDSNITGHLASFSIKLNEPFRIKFLWGAQGVGEKNATIYFSIDNKIVGSQTASSNELSLSSFEYLIEPGEHSFGWGCDGQKGQYVRFGDCIIERQSSWSKTFDYSQIQNGIFITDLLPNHKYQIQASLLPNFNSLLSNSWIGEYAKWEYFTTHNISITNPISTNITQTSLTITSEIDKGDAELQINGLQYKIDNGQAWNDFPKSVLDSKISTTITRLKPNTTYHFRAYAKPIGCDTVFSDIVKFKTLPVVAHTPLILKISQHEATLKGIISFGDANIYSRGMQFRKKGMSKWEDVEDGGNDSIYILVKKNLEMGATYQARTYVQPAGSDIIYSEILEFTTLDNYFTNCEYIERSQTSITFYASLADVDEGVEVEQYGFEYFIDSDGFFENADTYVKSDVYDVPVIPNGKELKTTITGLCPSLGLRWRAYAVVAGNKVYFSGIKNNEWNYAGTDRATIKVSIERITQTSITLKLDANQDGDAQVSQIEYALANSVQDTEAYTICGNTLTINNLEPGKQYNIRFRGTVNGRLCPLLKDTSWDYSWFEYQTLPITVDVKFSNISQTKANMKVEINSGDALISDLRYRIGYGEMTQCQENNLLTNLVPGQAYSVTIYATVNGKEMTWSANTSGASFKFTTKSVSTNINISETYQTAAKISWTSNVGDATMICSGLEFLSENITSESESGEHLITELIPNKSYSCRSYVETVEGGRIYSTQKYFTTNSITANTLPVSNISNRSATLNGTIDCDTYSSAEFGFQWKQMEGWASEPAFTKGRKLDDGTISVALVNGMLEPNTDYQYRTAVRYQDKIYYAPSWVTFRTESEFIYYPASVYTMFRTDRENNALVLCGYYVAGSESIVSQGYEYWQTGNSYIQARASQSPVIINTDASMQHEFALGELPNGSYNVRAFVKTESGATIYGTTLGFTSSANGYSGVDNIESELPYIIAEGGVVKVYNANQLQCVICSVNGQILANKMIIDSYDEFRLTPGNFVIVTLSNGLRKKIKI